MLQKLPTLRDHLAGGEASKRDREGIAGKAGGKSGVSGITEVKIFLKGF